MLSIYIGTISEKMKKKELPANIPRTKDKVDIFLDIVNTFCAFDAMGKKLYWIAREWAFFECACGGLAEIHVKGMKKNEWRCASCKRKGNIVHLVMNQRKLNWVEAITFLREHAVGYVWNTPW